MISIRCGHCGKDLKVKDELAGKKVKCPGCAKPVAVPQLAASLSPHPSSPGGESGARRGEVKPGSPNLEQRRTLPPKIPAAAEDRTLPPKNRGQATQESLADAGGHTAFGAGGQGEATQSYPADRPGGRTDWQSVPQLYDFLAPAEQPDEIGRLGPYRVLRVLGAGGMGVVFKAEDPGLQRLVALKAMLPSLASSPSAKERFFREARAAAALKHPHVVGIYYVGEDRGAPFLAMEFLEGEPLDERLKRDKKVPIAELLRIGREVAEGLACAHEKGLIHRDIKPANLWIEKVKSHGAVSSNVKILDFGLARALADQTQLTQQGAIIGTPAYMAPEQAGGKAVDHRCDLFSLGCVLYRMSTGTMAFKGDDTISILSAIALETPTPPAELNAEVPEELSDLIMRLLAKKAEDRPFSAHDVVKALREMEGDSDKTTQKLPKTSKPSEVRKAKSEKTAAMPKAGAGRKKWPLLVGGGAVLAAVIAGIVLFWQTPHGLVRIDSDDPSIEIVFDKTGPTIKGADKEPIRLRAGEHGLLVKRGDFSFETDKLLIKKGQTTTLKIELLGGKMRIVQDGQVLASGDIPVGKLFTNSLGMEFALVPKGKSWLGGGAGNPGAIEVEIPYDFYLGRYEVTQDEWEKVTGLNPSTFKAVAGVTKEDQKRFPVEQVSWDDCQVFIERLNKQVKDAGWVYRLPTEVEWEYACRGGPMKDKLESAFDFYFEKPSNTLLPDQANFEHAKGLKRTCKVGSYQPNRLGLYDMHGNVWEWCDDQQPDPNNPKGASRRVFRGGCWYYDSGRCRAADRIAYAPSSRIYNLGLRLARVPVGKEIVKIVPEEKKPAVVEAKPPPAFKNSLGMEFALVPKGKSWLGGTGGNPGAKEVEIAHDFYLGVYEVTQQEWEKVTGRNPSAFQAVPGVAEEDQKRFPVQQVSWEEAQEFIKRVNAQVKETGWVYRLPKEAEWEYACRGGPLADRIDSAFDFYFEKPTNQLQAEQANFNNVLKRTCKVGSYQPNRLGLYDMHGNVWEWCEDAEKAADGASRRVTRGGGWGGASGACRAAFRGASGPSSRNRALGLRLARVPVGKEIVKIAAEEKKPAVVAAKPPPAFKNSLGMEFVLVPKGKSWLGGGGKPGDKEVEIAHDFYLGVYEVTQEEWEKVTGLNPSNFKAVPGVAKEDQKRFPVEMVSWEDAQEFIKRLNEEVKEAGWVYRLPKEAEWEYACRGGPLGEKLDSAFDFYFDKPSNVLLPEQANFEDGKGLKRTCKVGSYQPNRLGLYDMHGNVLEWCQDEVPDPNNPKGASHRVARGGGWYLDSGHCRAAYRDVGPPSIRNSSLGLRLARVPVGKEDK